MVTGQVRIFKPSIDELIRSNHNISAFREKSAFASPEIPFAIVVVERADTPSRARRDVRSNVRARFLNALFGGALFGLVDTHITMASAAMRFAAATGRGNFSAPGNNPARDRAPVAQAALGGRRNALRAALRARSAAPTRFARGGVMPVNAKHTAVPEAQVRRRTR